MKYIQLFKKKVIERTENVPYLIRWNLFGLGHGSKWFSIKIHKILISDDECLHDHPWWFISIILKGSYTEWRFAELGDLHDPYYSIPPKDHLIIVDELTDKMIKGYQYNAGSILIRAANFAHRLEVNKPVYTLVFTFKKIRGWGFFSKKGWKHWFDYNKKRDC